MSDTELVVVRTFIDRIEAELAHSALEAAGIEVTAQDVPSARAVPLAEVLEGESR